MIELAQNIIGTQPILAVFLAIGLDYKHEDTPVPSADLVKRVIGQFQAAGCNAR